MKRNILPLFALSVLVVACGPTPQPVVYQQPQPQIVYQQPQAPVIVQQQSSTSDVLTGMAVGAMIANSARQPETRVIERRTTVVVQAPQTPQAAAPAIAPSVPLKPSFATPAQQPAPVAKAPSFAPQTVYNQAPVRATTITAAPKPAAAPAPSFAPKSYASTTTSTKPSVSSTTKK